MYEFLGNTRIGYLCLTVFVVGYYFIMMEGKYKINKTVPALFSGTLMFLLIGLYILATSGDFTLLNEQIQVLILEITEIYFFLFVAMTYIEVLVERNAFGVLKHNLMIKWYSYKKIFWILGFLAFFLSPLVDNLTTALILSTLALTLTKDKDFLVLAAINIVVAANAWWAFSPFGDITTLMAWTAGKGDFFDFFGLFPAALAWWIVTAFLLSRHLPKIEISPKKLLKEQSKNVCFKPGAKGVMGLGIFTIFIAVSSHQLFHIPAMWGMMFWLALLELLTYRLDREWQIEHYYIYKKMRKVQMDTLLFFFGILSMIGALGLLGYLSYIGLFYAEVGNIYGNIFVWLVSAVLDNVAVMNAVLKSNLAMWLDGWLFLTLTVWIWGSLISFWSAAWIGVMGKMRWIYTFTAHLKYFHLILLWYAVSIAIFSLQYRIL